MMNLSLNQRRKTIYGKEICRQRDRAQNEGKILRILFQEDIYQKEINRFISKRKRGEIHNVNSK